MSIRLAELEAKLAAMRKHECSHDEWENMCSVCADMDGIEHEIARLKDEQTSGSTGYPDYEATDD